MQYRLIFLCAFLVLLGFIFSLTTYHSDFNSQQSTKLSTQYVSEEKEKIEKKAHTEEVSVEPSPTQMVFANEQIKHGYEIFTNIGKCYTCHGKEAQGLKSQLAPRLAGQFDWYILAQLNAFKNKTRINVKMEPYIKKLTAEDFQDVASYLSQLK